MKKLILILLLIPNLVMAEVCEVRIYIGESEKEREYLNEVANKVNDSNCRQDDILNLDLGNAHMFANMSKYLIFQSQAKYCNFDKTISFDITGLNSNLTCSFKEN
jgi:hypothetical protein